MYQFNLVFLSVVWAKVLFEGLSFFWRGAVQHFLFPLIKLNLKIYFYLNFLVLAPSICQMPKIPNSICYRSLVSIFNFYQRIYSLDVKLHFLQFTCLVYQRHLFAICQTSLIAFHLSVVKRVFLFSFLKLRRSFFWEFGSEEDACFGVRQIFQ